MTMNPRGYSPGFQDMEFSRPSIRGFANPPSENDTLRMSKGEMFLIVSTMLAALLLNITPINAAFGLFLLAYLCAISLSNVFSALVALSASQVVADPIGFPYSLAQCMFVCWPLHLLLRRAPVDRRIAISFIVWTIPAALYFKFIGLMKWGNYQLISPFDLAVGIGIMAAWYMGRIRGRWLLALLCVGLGAAPAVISFWLNVAGAQTEGLILAKGMGEAGIGVGRSDGNQTAISIALAAVIPLAVISSGRAFHGFKGRWKWGEQIMILAASLPAVVATMSRGGVVHYVSGLAAIILFSRKTLGMAIGWVFVSVATWFLLDMTGGLDLLNRYGTSMLDNTRVQMEVSILASRQSVFEAAWEEILANPWIGTTPETRVSLEEYGYDYASHNVWLDIGRGAGIPGMIWFTIFFFYPIYRLTRQKGSRYAMPFIAAFAVVFSVFMVLSQGNHKTFYVLWVLVLAAVYARERPAPGQARPCLKSL